MLDDALAVSWQIVDDRNLYHRVASRLLTQGGTCHIDKHLCREGWVVYLHIELKQLVVGLAGHTLASEIDTVAYVVEGVHAVHLEHMGLVTGKVRIGLDGLYNLLKHNSTYTMRRCMPSPTGIVMERASLTPAFERTQTECPMERPGPKLV